MKVRWGWRLQGIIRHHGGEIQFRSRGGSARFEIDLPLGHEEEHSAKADSAKPARVSPLMLVDPDADRSGSCRIAKPAGTAPCQWRRKKPPSLRKRLKFDAVLWAMRVGGPPGSSRWSEFQETRPRIGIDVFVLLSDGYDAELARGLEEAADPVRPANSGALPRTYPEGSRNAVSDNRVARPGR